MRLDDLTWYELDALTKAGPPILILPTGSLEQHGPHLPLNTDTILPLAVADRVAAQIGALVAPPLPYGYKSQPKSGGGNHFPGCASLDGATYINLVRDMENQWFLTEAADLALRALKGEGIAGVKIIKLGYWTFINAATEAVLFPEGLLSWELEHAAVMETSVMLHLVPHLVRKDLIPDGPAANFPRYDVYPFDTGPIPPTGVLSSAISATAAKGETVLAQIVPEIAAALQEALSQGVRS